MRFDQKAPRYHEKADIQKIVADWGSEWIERDCGDLRALELGAGTGLFTRHLALRGFREFRATDLSSSMVQEGRHRLPLVDWGELDAWRCETDPVDRIYSSSLLQWALEPEDVLKNWRNALAAGGKVLVCLFVKGSLSEFADVDARFAAFPWRSESEWIARFEEAGFDVLRNETRSDLIAFDSPREALRSLHDIGAVEERRMSAAELRRFLRSCERGEESPFEVSWKAMKIECVRR